MEPLHHVPLSERSGTERMILEDIANVLDDLSYAESVMLSPSEGADITLAALIMESAPKRLSQLNAKWIEWHGIKDSFHESLDKARDEYCGEAR